MQNVKDLRRNTRYRAYQFSLLVIRSVQDFPEKRVYWIIGDQLLRAATSIGANLMEAQSSSSKKDFINFYHIALKSANETNYWLCLLRDSNLVERSKVLSLLEEAEEIGKMLGASLLTLKGKKI